MTGFRLGLGGAQEYYNVITDLTVFGKAVAAGYPIAGYGGKKEIMDLLDSGEVKHYGTFNSCSLCVSAAIALISKLSEDNGKVYTKMTAFSKKLIQRIEEIFKRNHINAIIQSVGSIFGIFFLKPPSPITITSYRDVLI